MHSSRSTFIGIADNGVFRMPTRQHITHCGQKVAAGQVGVDEAVDCEECITALTWEEIDKEETHGN